MARKRAKASRAERPMGRPRLSPAGRTVIVAVTLCPEHVEWLDRQPGGRSAAVRRLIDQERGA